MMRSFLAPLPVVSESPRDPSLRDGSCSGSTAFQARIPAEPRPRSSSATTASRRFSWCFSLLALVSVGAIGCRPQTQEPKIASSSSLSTYSVDFPQELDRATSGFSSHADEVHVISARLPEYADQLKDPRSASVALEVLWKAKASGQSYAYVDRAHELDDVDDFFEEEGPTIAGKVGGAAQYAVKQQKDCDVNAGGPAAGALKPAVQKQIDKRLRARNEAFIAIERARGSIPKEDAAVLEHLADDVARASFVVSVDLTEHKLTTRRLVGEADQVKATNADFIAAEKRYQADAGRTDAEKKASDGRIDAAKKSSDAIDAALGRAKQADKNQQLDKDVDASADEFSVGYDALKKKLKAKKG